MKKILFVTLLSLLFVFQNIVIAQTVSDLLINNDIGSYRKITGGGPSGGILTGANHFYLDHSDKSLDIAYVNDAQKMWVDVEVTQHAGGDSDRWLLHELDIEFRKFYGIPGEPYAMRVINGNTIITYGSAGWVYRWLSNNIVINIEYNDAQFNKPEPLEIVQAYLTKFPSTIPAITSADLRTADKETKWIKDEIDRRLWLCDKWNAQFQAGGVTQADLIYNLVRNMNVFLNYRQKYFSVSAKDDIDALNTDLENKNLAAIQTKLSEYKGWWNSNKAKNFLAVKKKDRQQLEKAE